MKNKSVKKTKSYKRSNVGLTEEGFKTIKDFCESMGYKIGVFVEAAALKRVLTESGKA